MTEKHISIDLNDPRMKEMAEVLSNDSCKKILNLLSENEWTETEIARELEMPLNSVDYNIKKLVQAGLIESSKHWWSVKGKKMHAYRVSNRKIVISPKKIWSGFVVPAVMTGVVAVLASLRFFGSKAEIQLTQDFVQAPESGVALSAIATKASVANDVVNNSLNTLPRLTESSSFFNSLSGWEWLVLGVWAGSILFFVVNYIVDKKR